MRKSRFTKAEIVGAVKQIEAGVPIDAPLVPASRLLSSDCGFR